MKSKMRENAPKLKNGDPNQYWISRNNKQKPTFTQINLQEHFSEDGQQREKLQLIKNFIFTLTNN